MVDSRLHDKWKGEILRYIVQLYKHGEDVGGRSGLTGGRGGGRWDHDADGSFLVFLGLEFCDELSDLALTRGLFRYMQRNT